MAIDIAKYIKEDAIITDLRANTKTEAISELVDKVFSIASLRGSAIGKDEALRQILEREKLQSTGVGSSVAFPHARIKEWGEFIVALGISYKGIDFDSIDKKPVYFICLMISSQEEPYIILQTMAAVARLANDNKNIETLFKGKTPEGIVKEFSMSGAETTHIIFARDIMRPITVVAHLDSRVEDIAKQMHLNKYDVIPVVDEDNRFYGEISCFNIFEYSIPDFFHQLNTVSFVRHFDPFEKYFKIKHSLTVKDILKSKGTAISEDTTLVEIIFQLTVKNKMKLFVANDGYLLGEIDRFSIVDKVLFF
ncbi:MAG: PTS sugar transporter subunit IIA [Candidatus Omnitrophota bacterium]|nr:PTS sugar transporter subunit IIA [Candidatus Omnitrophota bacterium]